jgi:site-specific recombinase XerD
VPNEFLDMLVLRGLSERTVRTYGYCLLSLWRWFSREGLTLQELTETSLLDYIRFQRQEDPAAKTINLRLTAARALYGFTTGKNLPWGARTTARKSFGCRRKDIAHRRPSYQPAQKLRVKTPRRIVVPLSPEDVADFLQSMCTDRDLSIVGLMLFCGLRSREVISLRLADLNLPEARVRVQGKGNKERIVPLSADVIRPLSGYLAVERPQTETRELFVSLKGPNRGESMSPAGLRSLFRYHRKISRVSKANAHRFRHTFAAEMVRAGISLPALMSLMGHCHIEQTLQYVAVSPRDMLREFHRAVEKLHRQRPDPETSKHD